MYLEYFFIVCVSLLCAANAQVVYDKSSQSITNMVGHTPAGNTEEISFEFNSISLVPSNFFVSLPSLDKIKLRQNVISSIADGAFNGTPSVTYIDLNHNQLSTVGKLMFAGLPNLSDLVLWMNQLHSIDCLSFQDNTALSRLELYDNDLNTLSPCMFDLESLPTALDHLKMFNNPLQCNESMCWLLEAEGEGWITVDWAFMTNCAGPGPLATRKWNTLTTEEMGCPLPGE